ncbi:MBL fold metallo-hydrolase [soil metagenome]
MLTEVADGVLVHESSFLQSNCVVVRGAGGVLLIDPGITRDELRGIAADLRDLGQPVVAGFSTHPDWDHVLWTAEFGDVPRYGTARGAASIHQLLAQADWRDQLAPYLPPDIADDIPHELFGEITGLPDGASRVPWDGPVARIIEHQGHAAGHGALLLEDSRVLVAGDMLSDILIPFFDSGTADAIGDYLTGLDSFSTVVDDVDIVIPGHGSIGRGDDVRARIEQDRLYAQTLRDGRIPDDPRVGSDAAPGMEWLVAVHEGQAHHLI